MLDCLRRRRRRRIVFRSRHKGGGPGFGGLFLRTFWLCATRSVQTGLVWFTKILTDPFHDVKMYHMAPVWLLRGLWFDPMEHAQEPR